MPIPSMGAYIVTFSAETNKSRVPVDFHSYYYAVPII
jgi:hypothetical protein